MVGCIPVTRCTVEVVCDCGLNCSPQCRNQHAVCLLGERARLHRQDRQGAALHYCAVLERQYKPLRGLLWTESFWRAWNLLVGIVKAILQPLWSVEEQKLLHRAASARSLHPPCDWHGCVKGKIKLMLNVTKPITKHWCLNWRMHAWIVTVPVLCQEKIIIIKDAHLQTDVNPVWSQDNGHNAEFKREVICNTLPEHRFPELKELTVPFKTVQ